VLDRFRAHWLRERARGAIAWLHRLAQRSQRDKLLRAWAQREAVQRRRAQTESLRTIVRAWHTWALRRSERRAKWYDIHSLSLCLCLSLSRQQQIIVIL
jgi:hypothetical protein